MSSLMSQELPVVTDVLEFCRLHVSLMNDIVTTSVGGLLVTAMQVP